MSHYIHHVPGRLRVRSRAFQCHPERTQTVATELRALDGVQEVRYNERIGSLTVRYAASGDIAIQVMATLAAAGCLRLPEGRHAPAGREPGLTGAFGKAVVTAVAQQAVLRSFNSLAAILR